jgi:hypothetical protein
MLNRELKLKIHYSHKPQEKITVKKSVVNCEYVSRFTTHDKQLTNTN